MRRRCPANLAVAFDPPKLTLGGDPRALLRVGDEDGAQAPFLAVSAGRLSAPRREGDAWVADYTPPEEAFPQVAVAAAFLGGRCGYASAALLGQGEVSARTRPGRPVEIRVGERVFGPVRAGADGRARVAVVAPPGVHHAFFGKQAIDLHLPPTLQLLVMPERSEQRTDVDAELAVLAVAVAEDGLPWRGAAPRLEVSEGTLASAGLAGAGAYRFRWRLAQGVPRTAKLTARLEQGETPEPILLRLVAGPPSLVTVTAEAPKVPADGRVALRVTVADAAGNPSPERPRVEASLGTVAEPALEKPGTWRTGVSLPGPTQGQRSLVVTARADGAEGRVSVAIEPGPVVRLTLAPPAKPVPADGQSEALVSVEALDRFGNPVDEAPTATAESGSVTPERAGGGWRLRYRAPLLEGSSADTVRVRLGPASAESRLALGRHARPYDFTFRLGLAVRSGNPAALEAGASATRWPLRFRGQLGFGLDAGWSSLSRSDLVTSGGTQVPLDARADFFSLQALARGRRELGTRLVGWAELGLGGALASTRQTQPGLPAISGSALVPVGHGSVALGLSRGPFLEGRATLQGDAGGETLHGSITTFTISAGWRLEH